MTNDPEVPVPTNDPHGQEFIRLFLANQRRLYGLILASVPNIADADDLLQETSVLMWQKFPEFTLGTDFAAWGLTFARFAVLGFYKKRRSRSRVVFDDDLLHLVGEDAAQISQEVDRRHEALRTCLAKLPEHARKILELRYSAGASGKSVAEQLSKSVDSIYKALSRIHVSLLRCVERTLATEDRL